MSDTPKLPLTAAILSVHFTGTETWHRYALVRSVLFTDGAKYVADAGGAYWLLDEIAQGRGSRRLSTLDADRRRRQNARLVCEDGNGRRVFAKRILFTDFPLPEVRFLFENNTILLPSEY